MCPEKLKLEWKHPQIELIQVCSNDGPQGEEEAHNGGNKFLHCNKKRKSFKVFFSKAIWTEKLKLLWRHPQVVWIQVSSNHGPGGRVGHNGDKFLHRYIYRQSLEIFYNSF